jgi:DNA-binding MarR family transcriptional regulator
MSGKLALADAWPAQTWAEEPARLKLEEHLPHALGSTAIAVARLIGRAYQDRFGVSALEWRLMTLLAGRVSGAPARHRDDLAAGAASDKAAVRRALSALARRGLAEEGPRGPALTVAGWKLYDEIEPLALAYEATLLTDFTPGEVTALKHLLRRLRAAADRLRGEAG